MTTTETKITTVTTTQEDCWDTLDTIVESIDALTDQVRDSLSCVVGTDNPFETLHALYRMIGQLGNPGRALAQALDGDRDEFMHLAYRLATVHLVLRDPTARIMSFRQWCVEGAMGRDATDTISYALALLERVRPPNQNWADWLTEVVIRAELRGPGDDLDDGDVDEDDDDDDE